MTNPDENLLVRRPQPGFWPASVVALAATAVTSFSPILSFPILLGLILLVFIGTFTLFRMSNFGINTRRPKRRNSRLLYLGFFTFSMSSFWLFLFSPPPAWLFILGVAVTLVPYITFAFAMDSENDV